MTGSWSPCFSHKAIVVELPWGDELAVGLAEGDAMGWAQGVFHLIITSL